jgi:hypothetical protein
MEAQDKDKGALRQGNYRLEDSTMPNSSPPKLEDSLWVENPLAEMLKTLSRDGDSEVVVPLPAQRRDPRSQLR